PSPEVMIIAAVPAATAVITVPLANTVFGSLVARVYFRLSAFSGNILTSGVVVAPFSRVRSGADTDATGILTVASNVLEGPSTEVMVIRAFPPATACRV